MGFAFWVIAARYYPPAEVGLASAAISAMGLLGTLSLLGLNLGLIRYLPKEENKQGMINSCFTIVTITAIFLSSIFIAGLGIWSPALLFIRANTVFLLLFIIFAAMASYFAIQSNAFVAMRSAKYSFFQNMILNVLKILLPILLISFGAFGIFSSVGIATAVAVAISSLFILKLEPKYRPIPTIKGRVIKDMLRFSFGNYIARNLELAPGLVLPLLIANILSPERAAYFYIAWSVVGIIFIIPTAITLSLFAEGSYVPERFQRNIIRAAMLIFILLVPAAIIIFFFGDKILLLFGKPYSENAFQLLRILVLSSILVPLNQLYITTKRVQGQVKPIIYVYAIIAIFTIGIGYILMKSIGLTGIGIGWGLSQGIVVLLVGCRLLMRKKVIIKLKEFIKMVIGDIRG